MEAFEEVVKVFLEQQNYVVTGNVKFPVRKRTKKKSHEEWQTHGYEIDLVAARSNSLILGTVKSFFGSKGVNKQHFQNTADSTKENAFKSLAILNDVEVQKQVIVEATKRYGYKQEQIQICFFVGKFKKGDESSIKSCLNQLKIGCGPVKVYELKEIMAGVLKASESKTYFNNPVIVTLKCLREAEILPDS
jgi:hypothetical protein